MTTDSDHAGPIYPDLAKGVVPDRPNQLWVADLTYVAIPGGFVYLAAMLDAWSRKFVGYAIKPFHGCPRRRRGAEGGDQEPCSAKKLQSSLRSRVAIRVRGVSRAAGSSWPDWLDESPRRPVR